MRARIGSDSTPQIRPRVSSAVMSAIIPKGSDFAPQRHAGCDEELDEMLSFLGAECPRKIGRRFDHTNFKDWQPLRVVFRKLGQEENEHWVNTAAVVITSNPWDFPPFSNNCHAEVVVDVCKGCTVRIGTMFQYSEMDPETQEKVWKPGSVFVSQIDEGELKRYETWCLPCTRAMEARLLCFALKNLKAPFHVSAYRLKAVAPWTHGVGRYDPEKNHVRNTEPVGDHYFCTQFVVLCLQAAAHEWHRTQREGLDAPEGWVCYVPRMWATQHTPNSLYKELRARFSDAYLAWRPDLTLARHGNI